MPPQQNFYDRDEAFWEQYLKGRPTVPESFFERIFAYHAEHNGRFETLHEPGAGVGVHTPRLTSRFKHVIVSDPSERNIEIAKSRLQSAENCDFRVMKLEDVDDVASASVDVVIVLNTFHHCDVQKAMDAVAHQLKPGGTLVIAGFGLSVLDDDRAQAIWAKMWERGSDYTFEESKVPTALIENRLVAASAYDAAPISEEAFLPGTVRMSINCSAGWPWYQYTLPSSVRDKYPNAPSRIGSNDKIVKIDVDPSWRSSADFGKLKELLAAFPWHNEDRLADLWAELEEVVAVRTIGVIWPVSLIMATKRNDI